MDEYTYRPLGPDTWDDLVALFDVPGGPRKCWCMALRLPQKQYEAGWNAGGEPNRQALLDRVAAGAPLGVLAYLDDVALGWCSVSPHAALTTPNARMYKQAPPPDPATTWLLGCLFVHPQARKQGITRGLIDAAVAYAASLGARHVEAYATVPKKDWVPEVFAWRGLVHMFAAAGFAPVHAFSPVRTVMRKSL